MQTTTEVNSDSTLFCLAYKDLMFVQQSAMFETRCSTARTAGRWRQSLSSPAVEGSVKILAFDGLLDSLYTNLFNYLAISLLKASCVCKSRVCEWKELVLG